MRADASRQRNNFSSKVADLAVVSTFHFATAMREALLKNSAHRETKVSVKLHFLVHLREKQATFPLRQGWSRGCACTNMHSVMSYFCVFSKKGSTAGQAQHQLRAGPTAASPSSFLQAEAWSPACKNRACEQRKTLLSRFFSWKMHFEKKLKGFTSDAVKAPNRKIFKYWAAVLVQGRQLPGGTSVWSESLLVSEVGEDVTPHSPGKRPHGAPQLRSSASHELREALMPIPCHWSCRF